ncbi:hypothetical protein [Halomarina pelagica]|uniref:hypothetical protein n=1 Tax=Halomarina pelagica TaxID=2961599 RepID=UPI0020C4F5B0|nr:hypothetical protein [Halomarina sp. BND7]
MSQRRPEAGLGSERRPSLRSSTVTRHSDGTITYFDGEVVRELGGAKRVIADVVLRLVG